MRISDWSSDVCSSDLARAVHAVAAEAVEAEIFLGDQPVGGLNDIRLGVEHVEHVAGLETGALADLEVVEIMPWRDLARARDQFGIGMFVGDHLEAAAGDRREDVLTSARPAAGIVGGWLERNAGDH